MEKIYNYCVIDCQFNDWNRMVLTHPDIKSLKNISEIVTIENPKIIVLDIRDRERYIDDEKGIFKTDMKSIEILNDKCIFAKYMMDKFPKNIPQTIFIKKNVEINYSKYDQKQQKMIKKNVIGYAGYGISIINNLEEAIKQDNIVVSEYIEHETFYSGHFLINKGIIIEQIYFESSTNGDKSFIQKSSIKNYKIITVDELGEKSDIKIFDEIFKDLNYSGFACPNFIIVNKNIIIFEINPRVGGSLMNNTQYFKQFFDRIVNDQL